MRTPYRFLLSFLLFAAAAPVFGAEGDIPTARVVLPWSDFKTLYERGLAPKEVPEAAPRDFAVSRMVYTGNVQDESAIFTARMKVDILKAKGWVIVPLLPTSVALRQARLGGQDAPVFLENGWYKMVTDRRGTLDIDIEFAVSTWESGGQSGFTFELPPSGATEVTVSVPSDKALDFEVARAQQVTKDEKAGVKTIHASLMAWGNLAVTWQGAAVVDTAVAETPRVYAEHQALMGVSEGLLQCTSTVNYSILHAGIDKLSVNLPADVSVLDVKGNGIRDWSVEKVGERQRILVDLSFEAQGAYSLVLDYERPLADTLTQVVLPDLRVENVERVKGYVGVDARSSLEISAGQTTDASAVDVRELPAAILGQTDWPVLLGFKYRKDSFSIPLQILQHDDVDMLVTIVDRATATSVMTPDGKRMTQMVYAMRNNRAQFLKLSLPEGATPWSTFVAGKAVKPGRADDGQILIPLARSQTSGGALAQFAVELVYVEDGVAPDSRGRGTFEADLPKADVPSTVYDWTVYLPTQAKVRKKKIETTMRRVDWFTNIDTSSYLAADATAQVQAQANQQFANGAMNAGVEPVKVSLPLDGQAWYFEKLLVLGEPLSLSIPYKKLKNRP